MGKHTSATVSCYCVTLLQSNYSTFGQSLRPGRMWCCFDEKLIVYSKQKVIALVSIDRIAPLFRYSEGFHDMSFKSILLKVLDIRPTSHQTAPPTVGS